ncbi:MAG: trypsin-like peptidase domain-containing protein [Betaproteobacteria bacterium]|nr:MAG: trypsin-like peptidase domain-containing protein [Betaproteobacteria bacterium]
MHHRWMSCLPLAFLAASVAAQIVAVPPAVNRSSAFLKTEIKPSSLLTAGGTAYAIMLAPPAAVESRLKQATTASVSQSKSRMAQSGKGVPLRIGFLRLALEATVTDPDVSFRFAESAGLRQVYGPYPANQTAASKTYWSPVLEGDTATVEIYLPADVDPASVRLAIPQISHLVRAGANLLKAGEPTDDIGDADSCEVDLVCAPTPANLNQSKAVAKMVFTKAGHTFVCTGTLLNDSIASNTPYFFTAAHCMNSQEAASNLFTYWFFDAVSCANPPNLAVPPYKTLASGAMLLGRSVDYDWALVRLNAAPPAGTIFSAWRAEPIAPSSSVAIVQHPEGDLKKLSLGIFKGDYNFDEGTVFSEVRYTQGATEAGSSGSGLLTLAPSGGFYELRGGLYAGTSACFAPGETDVYSRLDIALPLVTQYLSPDAPNPSKKTVVVESGWVRTGLTFLAYSDPAFAPADASPVCRFYLVPQYGDSHFYSADPAECAATAVKFAGQWIEESPALFYIQLPDRATGACPANTRPIYRFLNRLNQIHHRYTAEVDARNCMYYPGYTNRTDKDLDCSEFVGNWLEEGYGVAPAAPVMCGPAS